MKFLYYAKGSAGEVRNQLALLAKEGRVKQDQYEIKHDPKRHTEG
ncbi:hypothetical protein PBT90_03320 [Algoriphagus halophytocola]|uniref:Uncharacterized protein n=1 Tax=Algoriphagus halophytocola TaxID=2991499 RepID=A0ABY6MFP5_9BACT|nr:MULTISPECIES: hypothetical protein [unclassified Algoriphagus]UZD22458.1 hypothetical protein OM944_17600 [Algoriphagus sp. TR-M5]WBL43718.1 hypothetical protein PBT90_03320 [Algoriphagus sp. TR-M9]